MSGNPSYNRTPEGFFKGIDGRITRLEHRLGNSGGGSAGQYQAQAGLMQPFAGGSVPSGWLLCDGTSVLRDAYPELFAAIGTLWGSASSTTFNLPNMKGRVPVGRDVVQAEFDTIGETGGSKVHSGEVVTYGASAVTFYAALNSGNQPNSYSAGVHKTPAVPTFTAPNMPPYAVANWIISTGAGIGGGGTNVPALPDPVVKYGPDSSSINWAGTGWGDVANTGITFTLDKPMYVQADFGAQINVPGGAVYAMIGVVATGALVLQPEFDQATGLQKFGNAPFSFSSADTHIHGHKVFLLPVGTTTLTLQARRSTTAATPAFNYSRLAVTPIAWVGEPGPVVPAESGMVSITPTSVVNGTLFGSKVNFSGQSTISLNGVFSPDYDEYVVEVMITTKSANGGGWFRLRAAGVDDSTAGSYGYQGNYNNGNTTPATAYATDGGFAFATVAFNTMGKLTWKISGPAQGSYFKASHIQALGQNSGAILNMDIKGTKGGSTVYDGFSLVSSTGTLTGYLRVYGLA